MTIGAHQTVFGGFQDAFIVKFKGDGLKLWSSYYGGIQNDFAFSTVSDISQNVYLAGGTSSTAGISSVGFQNSYGGNATNGTFGDAFLVKFNSLGVRIWGTYYGGLNSEEGKSTTIDNFGNVYLFGNTTSTIGISSNGFQNVYGGGIDAFIVKFNSLGARQWATYYGGNGSEDILHSHIDQSGNIFITGITNGVTGIASNGHQNTYVGGPASSPWDAFLVKFNSLGAREWGTYYGGGGPDYGRSVSTDSFGNIFLSGDTESNSGISFLGHQNTIGGLRDNFIVKFNSLGIREWGTYYGGNGDDVGLSNTTDATGNIYIVGNTESNTEIASNGLQNFINGSVDAFILKLNSNGTREWGTYYGGNNLDAGIKTVIDNFGNLILLGITNSSQYDGYNGQQNTLGGAMDAFLVKFKQSKVYGNVWQDINSNCIREISENGIVNGMSLIIQPGNIIAQSINGFWSVDSLPAGNYTITINATNLNWTPTCPITQSFSVVNPNDFTVGPNFGLISTNPCSDADVSIYAPFLRPCLPNQMIYVSACNQSTATGIINSSYVDVELDVLMAITSTSLAYTPQGNNVYRFQTGDIYPGQCVNFNIAATISSPTVSCAGLLGQTLCIEVNLYPVDSCVLDTIPSDPPLGGGTGGTLDGLPQPCTLPWDQSSLSVDAWCQNDSIYFTITNTGAFGGGDMECYAPVWITVDGVLTFTDSILLVGGQTITYAFLGNGQTWILNAEQHPLHPGNSHPNAHIERCGDIINWNPDEVNDFPQDDADPIVDIYCGVVTGSYNPNDKTGFPIGQTDQFYIQPNQQLQYAIRFQNTGTDTAFTVVIRDTLDLDLNIFTVTPGVSSHNYEFRMYGPRVLEWTFNNIDLPDSAANQVGSNGFVTFHVEQVPDLAPGTEINNDADIYFDFNAPIPTNTTTHRIFEGFVSVAALEEMSKQETGIKVYPNPSNGQMTILLEKSADNASYSIFDLEGKIVKTGTLSGKKTTINTDFNSGMYFLMIGENVVKVQVIN